MSDFTEIIPNLWMGGEQLPAMPSGFDAVVDCRELGDWSLIGPPYLHIPMIDGPVLPKECLIEIGISFVYNAVLPGLKTLVHCAEGHNRSGLIVGAFLIRCNWEAQDAIDLIRSKRPGALTNQTFVNYLLQL
jgi:protein-tyrosine phosphatase